MVSSKLPWKRRADEDAEEYLAKSTNVYKTRRARYLTAKPIGETPAETVKKATNKEKWILGEELRGHSKHSEIGRPDPKPDKEETHRDRATEIISLFDDGYITEAEMLSRANGLLEEVGIWEDTIKEDNETKGAKTHNKKETIRGAYSTFPRRRIKIFKRLEKQKVAERKDFPIFCSTAISEKISLMKQYLKWKQQNHTIFPKEMVKGFRKMERNNVVNMDSFPSWIPRATPEEMSIVGKYFAWKHLRKKEVRDALEDNTTVQNNPREPHGNRKKPNKRCKYWNLGFCKKKEHAKM